MKGTDPCEIIDDKWRVKLCLSQIEIFFNFFTVLASLQTTLVFITLLLPFACAQKKWNGSR